MAEQNNKGAKRPLSPFLLYAIEARKSPAAASLGAAERMALVTRQWEAMSAEERKVREGKRCLTCGGELTLVRRYSRSSSSRSNKPQP